MVISERYSDIIYYVVTVTQYIIVALLLLILAEIEILNQYHTIILLIQILLSLFLSAGISALLVFRFLLWIKNKRDYLIIAYAAAAILISINSVSIALFMSLEMQGKHPVIQPFVFWTNSKLVNYDLIRFNRTYSLHHLLLYGFLRLFFSDVRERNGGLQNSTLLFLAL